MKEAPYRIEVAYLSNDPRGNVIKNKLTGLGYHISGITISDNYLINADISDGDIKRVADLLVQPVIQLYSVNRPVIKDSFVYAVEIGFLPGVTDNVSHTVRESIEDLLNTELSMDNSVFSSMTYYINGSITCNDASAIALELYNPLIQRVMILSHEEYVRQNGMGRNIPVVTLHESSAVNRVNLNVSDDELTRVAKEGILNDDGSRRGPLALDMLSMHAIKDYFYEREKRDPTDIEMESIAQTWSEHCKHTIFAAELDDIHDGIYKRYIKEARKVPMIFAGPCL